MGEYDETTDEFYYHQFLASQPDLNWRNPKVVEAMHNVMRFWLKKGVDGFRVDAFAYMLESTSFGDEPSNPDWKPLPNPVTAGYNKVWHTLTENQPGLHKILQDMQSVLEEFSGSRMMIGEIYQDQQITESDVLSYYGTKDKPEFNMPFNMLLIGALGTASTSINAKEMRANVDHYYKSLKAWQQPNWVLGNHDNNRVRTRFGGDEYLARSMHVVLLTLRGTPTIYNGDEFGMKDGKVPKARAEDPNCKISTTAWNCRDPERTPLQWDTSNANAGFTDAGVETWLPVSPDYVHTNVAGQENEPSSMLAMVRKLLKLRRENKALHHGSYESVDVATGNVFAYIRTGENAQFVVVHNFDEVDAKVDLRGSSTLRGASANIVLDSRHGSELPATTVVYLNAVKVAGRQSLVLKLSSGPRTNMGGFIVLFLFALSVMGLSVYYFAVKNGVVAKRGVRLTDVDQRDVEFSYLKEDEKM